MHQSQYQHMGKIIDRYLPAGRPVHVVELGSGTSPGQTRTHRSLLEDYQYTYLGVDVREANNVDAVMTKPYSIPARSRSADAIICGAVFEHVPFFWASILEMARVLKPRGYIFLVVPSRGHKHSPVDCWRMYPDGIRAIAAAARLTLREVHTHYPPPTEGNRHDYPRIDAVNHYWGDTVAVLQRPTKYAPSMRLVRPVVRWWANRSSRSGPLGQTPGPRPAARCRVLRPEPDPEPARTP